jgi:hypothetical protein
VPTIDHFVAHWALVDAELGAGNEMVLKIGSANETENVNRAALAVLRSDLDAAQDLVQSSLNGLELARGEVALGKASLLPLAQAYGRKVRGLFPPGSPFLGMTPEMPLASSSQEVFLRPLRDIANAWQKIEAADDTFTLPPNGTTRAVFTAKVEELATEWQELNSRQMDYGYELDKRNALQSRAEDILGRYRITVESLFAPENPLVLSIPRLRPLPGHTPDAVALTAVWDAAAGKARLTWPASTDKNLASYQVRVSPSETYDGSAESILATLPASGATEYFTNEGIPTPGSTASYKVYVLLDTDNESGSNAVAVTRPL